MAAKMPTEVVVGPFHYRVTTDKAEHNQACREEQTELAGRTDKWLQVISIEPMLASEQKADTLLHECLHAIAEIVGLSKEWGDQEEGFVRRLSPALLDLLQRNPQVVAYLLGPA